MSNRTAFLDMIAVSEGTKVMGDNGYNVLVGSTPKHQLLFSGYADHPRIKIYCKKLNIYSSAAGRYQLLARYYDAYKRRLMLPDFSPASQDIIALQQIKEQGALPDIDSGNFETAVAKCKNIWASLPGAGYGQRENKIALLKTAYVNAGGKLNESAQSSTV